MKKPLKPKRQCVSTLLLFSLVMLLIALLTNCEHTANLMEQPGVDCGEFLYADSLFAGRRKVVCEDSTLRSALEQCSRVGLFFAPYIDVTWHPSGDFIAFNYQVMDRIVFQNDDPCRGGQRFLPNTQGYWFLNPDGSGMRRVRAETFSTPAWSPDGRWLAFTRGAQIYKVPFNGECFDQPRTVQLTTQGRNFFPVWRPDGEWIAYDRSLADESGPGGIWIMKSDGSGKRFIGGGREPDWHPDGERLVATVDVRATDIWSRLLQYYPFEHKRPDTLDAVVGNDNRPAKYSPDGSKIAFASQPMNGIVNLWVMNTDGSDMRQLTTDGSRQWFD